MADYLVAESDNSKQRGPQNPGRYQGRVGNNYLHWGEQSGFVYNPWTDEYNIDPTAYSQYQEDVGITKPTPGILETIAPLATTSLVMEGAKGLGAQLPGMFGVGSAGAGSAGAGTATATSAAGSASAGSAGAGSASSAGAGSAGAGAGVGGIGLLPMAGIAGGTYLTLRGLNDLKNGETDNSNTGRASRAQTAISTFGFSELARLGGFAKETTNIEDKKLQSLKDKGLLSADFQIVDEERSREQQVKDITASGGNVSQFLRTGNVADLTPEDIQGYASLLERNPNDLNARLADARKALDAGAVTEGKGTINVDWDKVNSFQPQPKPTGLLGLTDFSKPPVPGMVNKPSFEPSSAEYNKLSTAQKDEYWRVRNG